MNPKGKKRAENSNGKNKMLEGVRVGKCNTDLNNKIPCNLIMHEHLSIHTAGGAKLSICALTL